MNRLLLRGHTSHPVHLLRFQHLAQAQAYAILISNSLVLEWQIVQSHGGTKSFKQGTDLTADDDFNKRLEIRFEQTGSPNPYYVAKSLNGTNLAVSVKDDGGLFLSQQDDRDVRQRFTIDCVSGCPGGGIGGGGLAADGCTIRSAFKSECVQVGNGSGAGKTGDRVFTTLCSGTDSQRFNFLTSPFAPSTLAVSGAVDSKLSSGSTLGDLNTLLRNSYIAIGLLIAVLIGLIVVALVMLSRGCLKGSGKGRYESVSTKNTY
ncbi:unnamed protein product [Somion occarium]|uniref:Uncharacterized protein n=1 Tax=Somion occarium TaxID=3059160 RepID=A0ABP1DJK0_9APHY